MAQRPKEEVRRRIVAAARAELATSGLEKTTLAHVASRAGTSIGNLYKYFAGKDELYAAAVPGEVARELARLLCARASALGATRDPSTLDADHPYLAASRELLAFTLAHRDVVLFLLDRADGTPHAGYLDDRVDELVTIALTHVARAYPRARPSAGQRRALGRMYRAFVQTLVAALRDERSEPALVRALGWASTYHLAGLRAFFETLEPTTKRGTS
jgi:AcrR family transcriptional regulator